MSALTDSLLTLFFDNYTIFPAIPLTGCIVNGCTRPPFYHNLWCLEHQGVYHHLCEYPDCTEIVVYDDEPFCAQHAPASGASHPRYSARRGGYNPL